MDRAVVQDGVVHLVDQDQQVVPTGQLQQPQQCLPGVHGAGRIVRVDDHQRAGGGCDLRADVVQIGGPAAFLVAPVVNGLSTTEVDRTGPERVIGAGDEDLVTVVQ